jgi:hypothetical protein
VKVQHLQCGVVAFSELSCELLRAGKSLRFRATGTSMRPLVRDADVLLVKPLGMRPLAVGEVVLCSCRPGTIVVHRVIRKVNGADETSFIIHGDQTTQPDGTIPKAQVFGRVVAIDRAGRHIDLQQPLIRTLGWLAAMRSRYHFGRSNSLRFTRQIIKRLPILSTFL